MFNLQPGIHFQEIKITICIHEKFHSTSIGIITSESGFHCHFTHFGSHIIGNKRGGALFDNFLMPALNTAFTFIKMDGISVEICKHLKLHMMGFSKVLFDIHFIITKRRSGFPSAGIKGGDKILAFMNPSHTFAAAPGCGFYQNRETHFIDFSKSLIRITDGQCSRHHRDTGIHHQFSGMGFFSHKFDGM